MLYLPWDVGLPAAPGLTEMLQDGASLVLLDTFWHHVQDVMHHSRSQLQVKVRLNALFCHLHITPDRSVPAMELVMLT